MLGWTNVSEEDLSEKEEVFTNILSWKVFMLCLGEPDNIECSHKNLM